VAYLLRGVYIHNQIPTSYLNMALNYAHMLLGVGNDADNGGICGDEPRQQADTLGFSQFAPVNSGLVFFCLFCVNKNAEFAPFFVSFESDMEGKTGSTIHSCTISDQGTALNPYLWRGLSVSSQAICRRSQYCTFISIRATPNLPAQDWTSAGR